MERAGMKKVRGVVAISLALLVLAGCKNDGAQRGDTPAGSNMCTEGTATCNDAPAATIGP
jgi:hypothetical protein